VALLRRTYTRMARSLSRLPRRRRRLRLRRSAGMVRGRLPVPLRHRASTRVRQSSQGADAPTGWPITRRPGAAWSRPCCSSTARAPTATATTCSTGPTASGGSPLTSGMSATGGFTTSSPRSRRHLERMERCIGTGHRPSPTLPHSGEGLSVREVRPCPPRRDP
jgi:hypothetical protein